MPKRKICADCGEVIDDWQAPEGGAWRVDGRDLCRWCYMEATSCDDAEQAEPGTYRYKGIIYEKWA